MGSLERSLRRRNAGRRARKDQRPRAGDAMMVDRVGQIPAERFDAAVKSVLASQQQGVRPRARS